jgi:predicted transposase/invertase (TIGR01784 family)
VIAIVDFHRSKKEKNGILNDKKVVETYQFSPSISSANDHLFDQWKATLIDLKKFPDKPLSQLKTDKDKWLYLLKNSSQIEEKQALLLKRDPVFNQALKRLERLSSDPKTRKAYENSINEQRDHEAILSAAVNTGREEGREQGRREEKMEIAKALLKQLLNVKQVAKATGLSVETILSLKS